MPCHFVFPLSLGETLVAGFLRVLHCQVSVAVGRPAWSLPPDCQVARLASVGGADAGMVDVQYVRSGGVRFVSWVSEAGGV